MTETDKERSESSLRVLVVLAHPDDPEFFCGGTVARWAAQGRRVTYCLLTRGDKGADEVGTDPQAMARLREKEQRATEMLARVGLAVKERRELDAREKAELDRAMDRAWANLPYHYQWLKDWEYV